MWRGFRAVMIVLGRISFKLPENSFYVILFGLRTSGVDIMPGARSDDAEIYTDIRPHERQPLFIEPVVALISTSYGVI